MQVAGDSQIVDERGRRYPLREGDVLLVKANVRHTGSFGSTENRILSVVTPARPEYPPEDGAAYFPGHGQPAAKAAPARAGLRGPDRAHAVQPEDGGVDPGPVPGWRRSRFVTGTATT